MPDLLSAQAAAADFIIVNKADETGNQSYVNLLSELKEINPTASVQGISLLDTPDEKFLRGIINSASGNIP